MHWGKEALILLVGGLIVLGVVKINKYYELPFEILFVPLITILFLKEVVFPQPEASRERKIAKTLAFVGFLILSLVLQFNYFIVNLFSFHYLMLIVALLPAVIYSLIYERVQK